jgi:hypothetical protein
MSRHRAIAAAGTLALLAGAAACRPRDGLGGARSHAATSPSSSLSTSAAPRAAPGATAMTIVDPISRSLIVRAARILVVHVESADASAWAPHTPSGEERRVSLSLKLEEVVKGPVRQRPGDVVKVDAKQVRSAVPWGRMPGVWSNAPVDPGARLVAFGKSDSDDAAATLDNAGCIELWPAAEAITDVHVAAQADSGHLDLGELLSLSRKVAPSLGALFADYLWARHETETMASLAKFDEITGFLEDPGLGFVAQRTLVMTLTTAVDTAEPPATKHLHRLVVTLFRLLGMPEAARLHDDLVATDLPNVLGLQGPHPQRPEDVFHDYPGEHTRARAALDGYKGDEPVAPLLAWLRP